MEETDEFGEGDEEANEEAKDTLPKIMRVQWCPASSPMLYAFLLCSHLYAFLLTCPARNVLTTDKIRLKTFKNNEKI